MNTNIINPVSTQVSDIWDLGGGREMSSLLSTCLNSDTLASTTLVIVLDLSNPLTCADSLLFWLEQVHAVVEDCMAKLSCSKDKQDKDTFDLLTNTYIESPTQENSVS